MTAPHGKDRKTHKGRDRSIGMVAGGGVVFRLCVSGDLPLFVYRRRIALGMETETEGWPVEGSLPVSQEIETLQRRYQGAPRCGVCGIELWRHGKHSDPCPIHTAEYHADRVPATLPEHSGSKLIITVRPA